MTISKPMTTARATFVVQLHADEHGCNDPLGDFARALDSHTELLRSDGQADLRLTETDDALIEIRCPIAYGPVPEMSEKRLQRQLEKELSAVAARVCPQGRKGAEVFHVTRTTLTPDDVAALIGELNDAADDVSAPLTMRVKRQKLADHLMRKQTARTNGGGNGADSRVDWEGDRHLQVIKMLAAIVKKSERVTRDALWHRVDHLTEPLMETVLGESGVTFASVREQHGITVSKLASRADNTERYGERNEYYDAVQRAYENLAHVAATDAARDEGDDDRDDDADFGDDLRP